MLYPEDIDYTSNTYSEWLSLIEEKGLDGETIDGVIF